MKLITRLLIVLLMAFITGRGFIHSIDHARAFDKELYTALSFIGIALFALIIFLDRKEFLATKKKLSFLPSLAGIISFLAILIIYSNLMARDKKPVMLTCTSLIVDYNGIGITFYQGGTYCLTTWGLGHDNYRGRFFKSDSIIEMDQKVLDSKRFLLRKESTADSTGKFEKLLYQVDSLNQPIADAIVFRVLEKKEAQ